MFQGVASLPLSLCWERMGLPTPWPCPVLLCQGCTVTFLSFWGQRQRSSFLFQVKSLFHFFLCLWRARVVTRLLQPGCDMLVALDSRKGESYCFSPSALQPGFQHFLTSLHRKSTLVQHFLVKAVCSILLALWRRPELDLWSRDCGSLALWFAVGSWCAPAQNEVQKWPNSWNTDILMRQWGSVGHI